MTTDDFLIANNISKTWPMKKISISFSLKQREALALLGPSGCGKTSILRIISGLLVSDSGTILLDRKDITNLHPSKRNIGMVFQDHALFSHLSVEGNIAYGLISKGISKKERTTIINEWLSRFKLEGFNDRKITSLSGGEQQRIALIRSLVVNPALMLFDEPLSSLDTELRSQLQTELRHRQQELGYTAIYVTHDEAEAQILADTIIRMPQM